MIVGAAGVSRHATPRLPIALSGTGDLFAGLVIAGLGQGLALALAVERAQQLTAVAMRRASEFGALEVVLSADEFRQALLTAPPSPV